MAKLYTFQCPECNETWEWLRHPSDEPLPTDCELCGAFVGEEPPKAPVIKLNIGTAKNKVGDRLYRQMEESSRQRAMAVQEATGASNAEVASMKISDLPDNTKPGENSAKAFNQAADAAAKNLSYGAFGKTIGPELQRLEKEQAAGMADMTRTGPNALSSRSVLDNPDFKLAGQRVMAEATARGNMGVDNSRARR